jgi:hypothetical protein
MSVNNTAANRERRALLIVVRIFLEQRWHDRPASSHGVRGEIADERGFR